MNRLTLAALPAALALAACAGPAPGLIGSYPQGPADPLIIAESPPGHEAPPPREAAPQLTLTYDASLTIEVRDTYSALYNVERIADRYNGYLLNSRTWTQSGDLYGEATIAVPASDFNSVKRELRWLGNVLAEDITGELDYDYPGWGGGGSFSSITVSLQPESANWGKRVWNFIGGSLTVIFWMLVILIPPGLMLIGLGTVAGWVRTWAARRRPPSDTTPL